MTKSETTFRVAESRDLEAVTQITNSAYAAYTALLGAPPLPVTEDYAPRIKAGLVWLGISAGRIIGLLVLERHETHVLIYSIAVAPERQGEGHGVALLAFAEQQARVWGLFEVRLYTNSRMERNIKLYTAQGYREVGKRPNPHRPGWVLVDMVKPLLPDLFQTSRVTLRPIRMEDAAPIFDTYAQDEEVTRFLTWRPHQDRCETETYIANCLATPSHLARTYVLADHTDHAVLGAFDLRWAGSHRLEFGYVLARPWWGRGIMAEVLTEVVDWARRQSHIFRIGSVCDVENVGSARVMEKAGLIREGVLRRWLVHPNISDEARDCYTYAHVR